MRRCVDQLLEGVPVTAGRARGLWASILTLTVASGCRVAPPKLAGNHALVPDPPLSVITAPTPRLAVAPLIKSQLRETDLPRDSGETELPLNRFYYSYAPGFPTVEVRTNEIRTRIPYQYRFEHYRGDVKWRWRGFESGLYVDWHRVKNQSGEVTAGFDTRFNWLPDWNLKSETVAVLPRGEIAKFLAGATLRSLASKVDREFARHGQLRPRFEEIWKAATQPISLSEGAWLSINPVDIWVGPFTTDGSSLQSGVGFSARPKVRVGHPEVSDPLPLPPLRLGDTSDGRIEIAVQGRVSYDDARKVLLNRLQKLTLPSRLGKVRIRDVRVFGLNRKVVVGAELDHWLLKGWIYLSGDLEYRRLNQTLIARNLKVDVRSWNPLVRVFGWIFVGAFEQQLEFYSYWPVRQASIAAMKEMSQSFNAKTKGQLKLELISINPITGENRQVLFTDPEGFIVALEARGVFLAPE